MIKLMYALTVLCLKLRVYLFVSCVEHCKSWKWFVSSLNIYDLESVFSLYRILNYGKVNQFTCISNYAQKQTGTCTTVSA